MKAKTTPRTTTDLLRTRSGSNEDPDSFDDRYELCEEGMSMYKKRSSTWSRKTPREEALAHKPIDWEGDERSAECRQQFEGKDGSKPFDYVGRDMERRKFFPARDEDHPAHTVPILLSAIDN